MARWPAWFTEPAPAAAPALVRLLVLAEAAAPGALRAVAR
jgi:hypothetical protein